MENQKLENLLNLALSATTQERERSESLSVGYDGETRRWELIIRHSLPLPDLTNLGIELEELIGQYGILRVPEPLIAQVSELPQIEYIEKPKRLFFAVNQAKAASCISQVQISGVEGRLDLNGRGVIVAVLDSGIDYFHQDFRREDGTTRILELWDQSLGRVYTESEINEALEQGNRQQGAQVVPSKDGSGHGTAVAGIAAGNGQESGGRYRGVAYESDLLIVKLGNREAGGFPRTTELMRAMNYAVRYAAERNRPLAVNLSIGNTYGSHEGNSLLETFMNTASNFGRTTLVTGTGNEGVRGGHASGTLTERGEQEIEMSVSPYETNFSVQLWKSYIDEFQISLITPSGTVLGPLAPVIGPVTWNYGGTRILIYYGEPAPYSAAQEIYFDFIPYGENYIRSGVWRFRLTPQKIRQGSYDFWLPSATILNPSTAFLKPSTETTLTIPATSAMMISVGAYDSFQNAYADFSGRGFTRVTNQVKPDLAAPGVGIMAPRAGGGYEAVTGTSFAAPIVTGASALLMQWGIVDGNDPFLFGEKVKAYLHRGARPLSGFSQWPNPQMGDYGNIVLSSLIEKYAKKMFHLSKM